MLSQDSEDEIRSRFVFKLAIWLWQDELNPRVRCAFGNVPIISPNSTQVRSFTGLVSQLFELTKLKFTWICKRSVNVFDKVVPGICQRSYMDMSKLLHGSVKVATCVCQVVTSFCRPLSNKAKLKFKQMLLTKLQHLTELNYRMPGSIVHLFIFFCLWPHEEGVGDDHLPVRSKARALVHLQKMKVIRQQVKKV